LAYEDHELSLILTDDGHIRELNHAYRGIDAATNVLSFSMLEGEFPEMGANLLGDLVISVETAQKEADEAGISLEQRLSQLLIHGMLHLVGYDHETGESEESRMINKSLELLRQIEPDADLDYF
jgi:probable rRNA maturation factor